MIMNVIVKLSALQFAAPRVSVMGVHIQIYCSGAVVFGTGMYVVAGTEVYSLRMSELYFRSFFSSQKHVFRCGYTLRLHRGAGESLAYEKIMIIIRNLGFSVNHSVVAATLLFSPILWRSRAQVLSSGCILPPV